MSPPLKLAVLISGNGSNLQSIIDAIDKGQLNAEIKAVISNDRKAYGLVRATQNGLHTWVLEHREYADRNQFDDVLKHYLEAIGPDYIVLAGFMRILGPGIIQAFENRILNIHPSLLPAYKGLNTHQRVLDNREKEHGVSIHLVTAKLDDGPIILQASYPIKSGDRAEDLQQRGHRLEHQMYPQLLSWLSSGSLTIEEGRIYYEQALLEKPIPFDA
ncbi:MAG: phosphoribosylglycinamide formyltransferase [Gammaproteobacteria bacterium]|nr:phosphoribosylglycinamide formyltransferase [Gammaproteobacteria bacterium]